jgi:hypothetical protein
MNGVNVSLPAVLIQGRARTKGGEWRTRSCLGMRCRAFGTKLANLTLKLTDNVVRKANKQARLHATFRECRSLGTHNRTDSANSMIANGQVGLGHVHDCTMCEFWYM